jgi:hypothetical protein
MKITLTIIKAVPISQVESPRGRSSRHFHSASLVGSSLRPATCRLPASKPGAHLELGPPIELAAEVNEVFDRDYDRMDYENE